MIKNTNIKLDLVELKDNELENVIGGVGARPPKRGDNFLIDAVVKFIIWLTEK